MAFTAEALLALKRRLESLRAEYKQSRLEDQIPPSIELLRMLRSEATNDSEFIVLTTLLESECSRFGLFEERESLARQMTELFPEKPMPWIVLAEFLLHAKEDAAEARQVVEIAVEKATDKAQYVRHAYNTRARVARRLGDFPLLEDTLKKLSTYKPRPGSRDIGYETDFLVDLPPGSVSEEVLRRYESVVARSRNAE